MGVLTFISKNWGVIATILFLISELLGESPSIKANSIYGTIRGLLKGEVRKAELDVVKMIENSKEEK